MSVVYLIGNGVNHKIGFTSRLKARIASFQTASDTPLTVLGVCDGGLEIEQKLHADLAQYRLSGEWFSLPNDVVAQLLRDVFVNAYDPRIWVSVERQTSEATEARASAALQTFLKSQHPEKMVEYVAANCGLRSSGLRKCFDEMRLPSTMNIVRMSHVYGADVLIHVFGEFGPIPKWLLGSEEMQSEQPTLPSDWGSATDVCQAAAKQSLAQADIWLKRAKACQAAEILQ